MQVISIAGNVGKDAEIKQTQGGDQFCRFSVAVSTGWGDKKATTWWEVTRWGKGADKLAQYLTKGAKVSVSGEVSTREHEGKTYLQIRADHVTVQGGAVGNTDTSYQPRQTPTGRVGQDQPRSGYAAPAGDALDDDCPW